jgi:PAS domain S-box-containing protein
MKNHELPLRKRAEEFLNKNPDAINEPAHEDIHKLIEELHLHQIELEMQNKELHQAQLELEATRDQYVDLYDFAPVGYMTLSEKGLILEANLTLSTMLGIERSSLIGKPFTRFITKDTQDDFYLHRHKLFETKAKQNCELKLKKKDNTPFHARLECILVEDAREDTIKVRAIITDISERKRTEKLLSESREKYRMVFENIQDVYYEVTLDGVILEISPSIREISKYSREDLIGTSVYNLYADSKKRDEFVREISKKSKVNDYGIILKDKDGLPKYCSILAKLSYDKNGIPQKIIGSIRDVTLKKQIENALRESEAQKTTLLDAAIDRIRYVDKDMKIIWANKKTVDESGMAHKDLVGKTCYQVVWGRNTPCEGCPTLRSKETGQIERMVMHRTKAAGIKGESYWDIYCAPLKKGAGIPEGFIQIARNITEQVQADEQINSLTHELMKAQESERQMISRELHDRVAQDLAAMKIDCERLLKDQSAIHPEFRSRISEMSNALQKSITAVRDLSYDLRPPDLDTMGVVQTLFQYCHDFSEKNEINVDFHSAGIKDLKLDFDTEIQLYRIVQESLTNIKKHAGASHVTIKLVAAFPNIILRIEDNGKGFDVQERLANITEEKRMGIRSIEERGKLLQGEMKLQSKPRQGTKIAIKFPYKGKKGDS